MIDWDKKDIFLVEKIYGPEPSLRQLLEFYYTTGGMGLEDNREVKKLVERYIKKFEKKAKE